MNGQVDRIVPNALDAERAVLGAMLVEREAIATAAGLVRPPDFYAPAHEFFADAIFRLRDAGQPVDKISLAESLRGKPNFDAFGGLAYLARCVGSVPTAANVEYYATLVREKATLRRLISAGERIKNIGFESESDVESGIAEAVRLLAEATNHMRLSSGGVSLPDALRTTFLDLEKATESHVPLAVNTPWPTVNRLLGGLFPEEMMVVAASPAQGKTGMIMNLADYIAHTFGGTVAFFTLEMSVRAIAQRWLAMVSAVSARNMRLGTVEADEDFDAIGLAIEKLARRGVQLFGSNCGTIEAMRRELTMLSRDTPIKAIFVDHVGLVTDSDTRAAAKMSRHERLDATYLRLLALSREFQAPMIVVQHMNRQATGEPTIKDITNIRDGGNPEGHAHSILFTHRVEPDSPDPLVRLKAKFIIGKSRDGDVGSVPMTLKAYRHLWLEETQSPTPWFDVAVPV